MSKVYAEQSMSLTAGMLTCAACFDGDFMPVALMIENYRLIPGM